MSYIVVYTTKEEKEVAHRCKNFCGNLYVAGFSDSAGERMEKARRQNEKSAFYQLPDRTGCAVGGIFCAGKMGD